MGLLQGLRGFFRGYLASIITFCPNSAIWWLVYSGTRRLQTSLFVPQYLSCSPVFCRGLRFRCAICTKPRATGEHEVIIYNSLMLFIQAVSGFFAGAVSAVATNPLDVVRTRLQVITLALS